MQRKGNKDLSRRRKGAEERGESSSLLKQIRKYPIDISYLIGYNLNEEMTREFVMMPEFDRQWKRMGLEDAELRY